MCITKKLFVSYTLKDKVLTVEHLRRFKTQVPLSCDTYIDILDNDSQDKQGRVNKELVECDELKLIDTPSVRNSNWVNYELAFFNFLGKPIESIDPQSINIISNSPVVRHKVFISYNNANDQWARDRLIELNNKFNFFIDATIDAEDMPNDLCDREISKEICSKYPHNSTVTVLLLNTESQHHKQNDWNLSSILFDCLATKCSGIVIILLPYTGDMSWYAVNDYENKTFFTYIENWESVKSHIEYNNLFPFMPGNVMDQLMNYGVKVFVTKWDELNVEKLAFLINNAANN